ncbi:MAG: hypothetical protein GC152_10165 [Alphaproteobacteria bacterium]|nr:hypothetical protein [Alphaproteobacteria bacterium]
MGIMSGRPSRADRAIKEARRAKAAAAAEAAEPAASPQEKSPQSTLSANADGSGTPSGTASGTGPSVTAGATGRASDPAAPPLGTATAIARLEEWRLALAKELGEAPAAGRDEPRRMLAMLNVLGRTRRTAESAFQRPAVAAAAAAGKVDETLDDALADLESLAAGSGGPDALNKGLAPIRARIDLTLDVAEIAGWRTAQETSEARTWFAERAVDLALKWLLRSAVARGEIGKGASGRIDEGVFILAGGDFATRDLVGGKPIEAVVVYGGERFAGDAARMAERAFVRLGAELRDALNGGRGEPLVYSLKTPLGDGVNGQGVTESAARLAKLVATPQTTKLAQWIAGGRIVAGDVAAGGSFLEEIDGALWNAIPAPTIDDSAESDGRVDSRTAFDAFRRIAMFLRHREGPTRPCFRSVRVAEAMTAAADCGLMPRETATRLSAAAAFALAAASRARMVGGDASAEENAKAIASLCGFADYELFEAALIGGVAQADDALATLAGGAQAAFAPFRQAASSVSASGAASATASAKAEMQGEAPNQPNGVDATTLEQLGFTDGSAASARIDGWAARWADDRGVAPRFAAIAPGLLTAFGETMQPDDAARLFDRLLANNNLSTCELSAGLSNPATQDILATALGDLTASIEPITTTEEGAALLFAVDGNLQPRTAAEFFQRFSPDAIRSADRLGAWRRGAIARVAALVARGDMNFDAAAATLELIDDHTLADAVAFASKEAGSDDLGVIRFASAAGARVGGPRSICLFSQNAAGVEGTARRFIDILREIGDGVFALPVSFDHRMGGDASKLVTTPDDLRAFLTEQAIAQDRLHYSRARIVGPENETLSALLRAGAACPRRADATMRDLDRMRTQRLRQEPELATPFDQPDGGAADVDLIIGSLTLRHAAAHPMLRELNAADALDALARADLVSSDVARTLAAAHGFHARLSAACGLAGWKDARRRPPRRRFGQLLARAAGVSDLSAIRPLAVGYAEQVRALYAQIAQGRPSQGLSVDG